MRTLIISAIVALSVSACSPANNIPSNSEMSTSAVKVSRVDNITTTSRYDFAETDRRLKAAIDKRGLTTFAVVNHGDGARSVDMDIGESKLYIFGNPKSGTPLMTANRQMGLELPMKILVNTDADGTVNVSHPDITAIATQNGVTGKDELLGKISMTLRDIVGEAAS